jgi:hypothetical protein
MAHVPGADHALPPQELARARLQGKRAALVIVTAVAVVFIGWSAVQIIPAVFGVGVRPIPAAASGSSERACAEGIRRLELALDRSAGLAGLAGVGAPPSAQPTPATSDEWQDAPSVEQVCSQSPEGEGAWAALLRLRSAQEQLGPGPAARGELDPLRRDVGAHLPADLR